MAPDLSRLSAICLFPPDLAQRAAEYQLGYLAGTRQVWLEAWQQSVWLGPTPETTGVGEVVGLLEQAIACISRQSRGRR